MNNIALLISTFDNSEDLWSPLEQTYLKFWDDINIPIYLCNNHKRFNGVLFESLLIGDEISWSDNLIKCLNKINQEYVLLTFDDLFLIKKVDNAILEKMMAYSIENKFNYLQFYRSISNGKRISNHLFKKFNQTKYKNSTIWSFWKKDVLLKLLVKEESAWEFERKGNVRSFQLNDFYSTRENIIPFVNGVVRGVWNPLARNKLKLLGISISDNRAIMGKIKTFFYKLRDLQFDLVAFLIHKIY
jgi:hypothetical protein|tara:strand:+ start:459 stop:1190 length:732 start_codon:yes stop_codon:yes gene_type:complete